MPPPAKRLRLSSSAAYDDIPGVDRVHQQSISRLKSSFEAIFDKYGKDFGGVSDEIDLKTGEVVVDNGHLANIKDDTDVGPDPEAIREKKAAIDTSQYQEDSDDELSIDMPKPTTSPRNHDRALVLYQQPDPPAQIFPNPYALYCHNGWMGNSSMPTVPNGQPMNIFDPYFMQNLIAANMKQMLHSGQMQTILPQSKWAPPPLSQDPFAQPAQDEASDGHLAITPNQHDGRPGSAQSQYDEARPSLWAQRDSPAQIKSTGRKSTDGKKSAWTAKKDRLLLRLIEKHKHYPSIPDLAEQFPHNSYYSVQNRFYQLKKAKQPLSLEQKPRSPANAERSRSLNSMPGKTKPKQPKGNQDETDPWLDSRGPKQWGYGEIRQPFLHRNVEGIKAHFRDSTRARSIIDSPLTERSSLHNPRSTTGQKGQLDKPIRPELEQSPILEGRLRIRGERPSYKLRKTRSLSADIAQSQPRESAHEPRTKSRLPQKEPKGPRGLSIDPYSPQQDVGSNARGEISQDFSHVPIAPGMPEPYVLAQGTLSCPLSQCPWSKKDFGVTRKTTEHMKTHHGWPRPNKNKTQPSNHVSQGPHKSTAEECRPDREATTGLHRTEGADLDDPTESNNFAHFATTEETSNETSLASFRKDIETLKPPKPRKSQHLHPDNALGKDSMDHTQGEASTKDKAQNPDTATFPKVVIPISVRESNTTSRIESYGEQSSEEAVTGSDGLAFKKSGTAQKRKRSFLANNKWSDFANLAEPAKPVSNLPKGRPNQPQEEQAHQVQKVSNYGSTSNANVTNTESFGRAKEEHHFPPASRKHLLTPKGRVIQGSDAGSSSRPTSSPSNKPLAMQKIALERTQPLFGKASTPLRQSLAAGNPDKTSSENALCTEGDDSEDELAI